MKNYYELLEVDEKASKEVIDKAFRILAKRYHPDTQSADKKEWAEENFKKINEAYEVLSNDDARKKYDAELDYAKNRTIQELINKNEYLEKLVNELQNELTTIKYPNNSFASTDYSSNISANRYTYQTTNYNNTPHYEPNQTVYYDTKASFLKNRLKDFIALIITIIFLFIVAFILWKIPFTNKFFVKLYEENAPIKAIVDLFLK